MFNIGVCYRDYVGSTPIASDIFQKIYISEASDIAIKLKLKISGTSIA